MVPSSNDGFVIWDVMSVCAQIDTALIIEHNSTMMLKYKRLFIDLVVKLISMSCMI